MVRLYNFCGDLCNKVVEEGMIFGHALFMYSS